MGNASPKKVYVKPVHTMARRMVSGRWNQSKQPVGLVRFICWLSRCRRRAADLAIAISGVIGSEDVRLCMMQPSVSGASVSGAGDLSAGVATALSWREGGGGDNQGNKMKGSWPQL